MKLTMSDRGLLVESEQGDTKYYGTVNGAGESNLLYAIKRQLNAEGADFIKKRMWKDGHMVDDLQQYLRMRQPDGDGVLIAIYNPRWAIEGANDALNRDGKVTLAVADIAPDEGMATTNECRHCGRSIIRQHLEAEDEFVWIDPEATGDDSIWREVCDKHDTFIANHEPTEATT